METESQVRKGAHVMRWILIKFLKDSLDFLSENENAKKWKRQEWVEYWISQNIPEYSLFKNEDSYNPENIFDNLPEE